MDTTAIKQATATMMETLRLTGNNLEYREASRAKDAAEQALVDQGREKLRQWAEADPAGFLTARHWEHVPAIANTRNDMWVHPGMSQYLWNPRLHEYAVTTADAISEMIRDPWTYFGQDWLEKA